MASPSIVSLNLTDSQQEIVSKLNLNFEEISSANGGVQGPMGPTGATGQIGAIGPIGSTGLSGGRGTRWFVGGAIAPTGGYGDIVIEGDYWIDTLNVNKNLYSFTSSGWEDTGFTLVPQNEFTLLENISSATGSTGGYRAIVQDSSFPIQNTFVISDGSPSVELTNPDYTNFLISTDPSINDYPIMEFARGDDGAVGPSGYFKRPIWRWTGGDSDYNLAFIVPSDNLTILTGSGFTGSVQGNLNIQANDSLVINSGGGLDITSGSSSFLNSSASIGITASNILLNGSGLITGVNISIETSPGKSPSPDPVYGDVSVWIDNPSGTSLHLGASGGATSGNPLVSLQTSGETLSEIRTDGVVYIKKDQKYPYLPTFDSTNVFTSTYGGGLIVAWYYMSVSNLGQNNTFIMDLNPANDLGLALNLRAGSSENIMNLLERYQSMRIKVLTKTNSAAKKIKYLGYLTGAPPASNQYVNFPNGVNEIDLLIMRGETTSAGNSHCLYWTNQGSGRLF